MKKVCLSLLLLVTALLAASVMNAQSNWKLLNSGTTMDLKAVDFINENEGIAAGIMGTIIKTVDGGLTWTAIDLGMMNFFHAIQYIDQDRVIIGGDQGIILYSNDGGGTWDIAQPSGEDYNIYAIAVDPVSGKGIAGGSGNTLLWTENHGVTWTYIEGGMMNHYSCACMADGDFGVVIGVNAIFHPMAGYTMDGGQTFDGHSYYPSWNNTGFESTAYGCHFFNSNDGFTVGTVWNGQGFLTTEVSWGNLFWDAMTFEYLLFEIDFINNLDGVIVGGDYNVTTFIAETKDGGLTWQPASVEGNGNTMLDVVLVGSTGYAVGTFGEILKKEVVTRVNETPKTPLRLYSYPNPSKGNTNIHVELDDALVVDISLYDMTGRVVAQIFSGELQSGVNTINLNTANLPKGVYQYSMKGNQVLTTKKLVVE